MKLKYQKKTDTAGKAALAGAIIIALLIMVLFTICSCKTINIQAGGTFSVSKKYGVVYARGTIKTAPAATKEKMTLPGKVKEIHRLMAEIKPAFMKSFISPGATWLYFKKIIKLIEEMDLAQGDMGTDVDH